MSAQVDETRPAWTPQADATIRATYGEYPARRIAQHLGVRTMQVVGRAKALGLVAPVVWSDREDRLLRRHYRGGDSASIAARYGMTAGGVQAWIAKGWLPAVKGHTSGGTGRWYIREADLAGWTPPRPELAGRRGRVIGNGVPCRVAEMVCRNVLLATEGA